MCLQVVGRSKSDKPAFAGAIFDFLTTAKVKSDVGKKRFPSFLCDLEASNPSPFIGPVGSGRAVVFFSSGELQYTYNSKAGCVIEAVSSISSSSFIQLPSSNNSWTLWLTTWVDMLHMLRARKGGIYETARYLLESGIPFSTRIPMAPNKSFSSPPPMLRTPDSKFTFPIRLRGYSFTYDDYMASRRLATSILNLPHGRAALLMGGIIWRLAIEILSIEDVLKGPSSSVSLHGIGRCLPSDGIDHWDDMLSVDQLDLICGLNLVENGMFFLYHCTNLTYLCVSCKWKARWDGQSVMVATSSHLVQK
jgi:hypothetical protein